MPTDISSPRRSETSRPPADIGLARAGADPGIGLHPLDQDLEIAGRQVEIEVELAEIGKAVELHRVEPGVERLDHARPDGAVAPVGLLTTRIQSWRAA
jgi:hypothetical protein